MKSFLVFLAFCTTRTNAFCPTTYTATIQLSQTASRSLITINNNAGYNPLSNNILQYAIEQKSLRRKNSLSVQENGIASVEAYKDSEGETSILKNILPIINAALLVSGTTIGGGFLALPAAVAPSGFFPSAVALIGVWMYFLAQSFVLVECITRARNENDDAQALKEVDQSIAATAKSVFGVKGEIVFGALLAILIQATLVSQISRAGMMFPNYRIGCIVSALSIAGLVFGPTTGVLFASKANALLTTLFLLSCAAVFGCGFSIADWSRLSASTTDWSLVFPAIPTFLQLLVYGEIVPSVCQILKYNTKHIHGAIILGSFLTLCLQLGWSGLGLSLTNTPGLDPVNLLLSGSNPVQIPLFCLAFTAILTTILGSYLALLSTASNLIQKTTGRRLDEKEKAKKTYSNSIQQRMKVASIITIPASLIACTSPTIFLQAIDFAGSYPVLILWGVIPPIMTLVQRYRNQKKKSKDLQPPTLNTAGSSIWLAFLASVSLAMVGMNAIEDLMSLFRIG